MVCSCKGRHEKVIVKISFAPPTVTEYFYDNALSAFQMNDSTAVCSMSMMSALIYSLFNFFFERIMFDTLDEHDENLQRW